MSDYNSSLPVRTENAGDVIARIADATITSQQLAVNADGSVNITDNGGSLTVDGSVTVTATDLDIRDLSAAQDNVAISDGTNTLAIEADGSLNATVVATDLDIRDLSSASDSVEVLQATHDNLNVNANIQVGDADVDNANPVPVSDAGGSLTVDATDLDIRDLAFATDKVDVSGSEVSLDAATLAALESITVSATDLDIRNLSASQDNVAISDGSDTLAINSDGSINVVIADGTPGTAINNYNVATVAADGTSNHDYTVTALKTLALNQVHATASGKMKIEIQVESGVGTSTFNTRFVGFNSTANPNIDVNLANPVSVAAGVRVRVIRTNLDKASQDLYSTICGYELP